MLTLYSQGEVCVLPPLKLGVLFKWNPFRLSNCWFRGLLLNLMTQIKTQTRTVGLSWTNDRPLRTQQRQETNSFIPSGIRTRNLRNRAVADLRLRPLGHRDWLFVCGCVRFL